MLQPARDVAEPLFGDIGKMLYRQSRGCSIRYTRQVTSGTGKVTSCATGPTTLSPNINTLPTCRLRNRRCPSIPSMASSTVSMQTRLLGAIATPPGRWSSLSLWASIWIRPGMRRSLGGPGNIERVTLGHYAFQQQLYPANNLLSKHKI